MREISLKNYIVAGIITLLVFITGLMLGLTTSDKRVSSSEQQINQHRLELDSLQLQYLFIDQQKDKSNCAAISFALEENVKKLAILGDKIESYSEDINFNELEFNFLKREYTLAQIRYWLVAKKAKQICSTDAVSVFYFYSNEADCFGCSTQSRILTHLKGQFKDKLLVFSLDSSFLQEPLVPILRQTYNIIQFPSIVIEDDTLSGLVEEEELTSELCKRYEIKPSGC